MTFPEMCDLKGTDWSIGYPQQSSDYAHLQTCPPGKPSANVGTHYSPGLRGTVSTS